jgi:hypothetical protein
MAEARAVGGPWGRGKTKRQQTLRSESERGAQMDMSDQREIFERESQFAPQSRIEKQHPYSYSVQVPASREKVVER